MGETRKPKLKEQLFYDFAKNLSFFCSCDDPNCRFRVEKTFVCPVCLKKFNLEQNKSFK